MVVKLEDILKNNQQQAQGYGTLMGGQVGPYQQQQIYSTKRSTQ